MDRWLRLLPHPSQSARHRLLSTGRSTHASFRAYKTPTTPPPVRRHPRRNLRRTIRRVDTVLHTLTHLRLYPQPGTCTVLSHRLLCPRRPLQHLKHSAQPLRRGLGRLRLKTRLLRHTTGVFARLPRCAVLACHAVARCRSCATRPHHPPRQTSRLSSCSSFSLSCLTLGLKRMCRQPSKHAIW